ncbi:MAG: hypothetical protein Q8P18_13915 [Pseudomonadota bacterium]|nr:hypothetical protein [Pseudomonadota bacterium]
MIAALALSLVGEALNDEQIGRVFGEASLSGEVSARVTLPYHLEAKVTVGYQRVGGMSVDQVTLAPTDHGTWFWYAPISTVVGPRLTVGSLDLAAGVGPTIVPWAEEAGAQESRGYSGTKIGVLGQVEARLDVSALSAPSLRGPDPNRLKIQIVGGVGVRATLLPRHENCDGEPCGLDLGGIRLALGVSMVVP